MMISNGKLKFLLILFAIGLPIIIHQAAGASVDVVNNIESTNWQTPFPISQNTHGSQRPSIAATSNGKVLVAFALQQTSNSQSTDPFYRLSTNFGQSWLDVSPIKVTNNISSRQVNVIFDNNEKAHAVWTENGNTLAYAPEANWNSGSSYQTIYTASGFGAVLESPKIIPGFGNLLHVVWAAKSATDFGVNIYYARSTNSGASWTLGTVASNSGIKTDSESNKPDIAISSDGKIHITWQEQQAGDTTLYNAIMYSQSSDNGNTWSQPVNLSEVIFTSTEVKNHDSYQARIIAVGNTLKVVFVDREEADENYSYQSLYYLECSTNCVNKNNWKQPSQNPISQQTYLSSVKDPTPYYIEPTILHQAGCTTIYFHGIRIDVAQDREVVFGMNSCNGWDKLREIITDTSKESILPTTTTSNNWWLFMAYEDTSTTNHKIMFLRNQPALYMPLMMRQYVAGP